MDEAEQEQGRLENLQESTSDLLETSTKRRWHLKKSALRKGNLASAYKTVARYLCPENWRSASAVLKTCMVEPLAEERARRGVGGVT